ncbi:hypothetical protein A0H81_00227 [Grifola frondosa]|uniref:Uncharacterized protein n=1 Tax=Grifola frondosa TaxID=5627 RepID=A0A1C7MRJ1_GRIFR|nr:hypothetical protein A0H81_00227 [Grifola frondosa]
MNLKLRISVQPSSRIQAGRIENVYRSAVSSPLFHREREQARAKDSVQEGATGRMLVNLQSWTPITIDSSAAAVPDLDNVEEIRA